MALKMFLAKIFLSDARYRQLVTLPVMVRQVYRGDGKFAVNAHLAYVFNFPEWEFIYPRCI